MPTKECPACAMEIESSSKVCPICGYEFAHTRAITSWVAILLAIVFLLSLFVGYALFL